MRSESGMSSAFECVRNGRADAPPATLSSVGVSTSKKLAVVDEAPHLGEDPRALDHHAQHVGVGDEIDVATPVALLDVLQPVPLVGQRTQRFGQHLERSHGERKLAGLRAEDEAGRADDVAALDFLERRERLRADIVLAHEELETPAAVAQIGEDHAALPADRHDPPGERPRLRFGAPLFAAAPA